MSLSDLLLPSSGRLSEDDVAVLQRVAAQLPDKWRVGHLFPSRREQRALARFEAIPVRGWDLRWRSAPRYDALVAGRVFGSTSSGQTWFQSALGSCHLLVVLDSATVAPGSDRLLAELPAPDGSLQLYRGDFTDPLLRVDDYPTGVRPILDDLTSIHDVLSRIDESGLPFHLGIVPAILEPHMAEFLRGLQHLVVCMHGCEHGYAKHSKILIDAGDPFNQRGTVVGFDEFAGRSYEEIERLLRQGRQSLEASVGRSALCYIPPNNEANRLTGRALLAAGFEYLLSERRVPGCELPCIASDFYDRSSAFRPEMRPNVASLHATWEADMQRAGDAESLPRFLAALIAQRARAREGVARVAERIAADSGRM
jgi:hypothetical protein